MGRRLTQMKVLLTTQPGYGHLHPMVAIGQALQAAGHEVRVACAESFMPRVEKTGLTAVAAGLDWSESEPELAFPEVEEMSPRERELFFTDLFLDTTANYMTHDLLELCQAWRPDVIVRDSFEYGGCIAGERLNIPHAAVDMELYIPGHVTRRGMESQLAYLRSAYGLPPHPALEMLTRYLYFSYIPPSYQFPEYGLPAVVQTLRPAFLEPSGNEALPAWVAELPDQPTIYASMGTSFNNVPEIFKLIIAGLAGEPLNLIITIGRSQDPAQYGPLPDNVHVEQYIPQAALMPYCDLAITNGGVGTNMIALNAGLPLLIVPLGGHMHLHAVRCRALGLGLSLKFQGVLSPGDAAVSPQDEQNHVKRQALALAQDPAPVLSPGSVRDAVYTLLKEPVYRQAAQRVQAEMLALPAVDKAVALLEQLAAERMPIHQGQIV